MRDAIFRVAIAVSIHHPQYCTAGNKHTSIEPPNTLSMASEEEPGIGPTGVDDRLRHLVDTAVAVVDKNARKQMPPQQRASNTPLSIEDIHKASPLEAEAETSILKAVEEREDRTKAGSHLFDKIPPYAVELFRKASQDAPEDPEDNERIWASHKHINTGGMHHMREHLRDNHEPVD